MRRLRRVATGIAVAAAAAAVGVGSTGSAVNETKPNRWKVRASVVNGYQHLSRISDTSTPGHKGQGSIHSAWFAVWLARVKIVGSDAYLVSGSAFEVEGSAHGEYRGSYPKTQTETAHFTCSFGPVKDGKLLTRLRLFGVGRTDGPVHATIGISREPRVLPPLGCSGDTIDAGTPKTISGGILTGIETACFGDVRVPGAKLKHRKAFRIEKRFGWHPDTPYGMSRPCSGFGDPIRSAGSGTLRLSFRPIN